MNSIVQIKKLLDRFLEQTARDQWQPPGVFRPQHPVIQAVKAHPVQPVHVFADHVEPSDPFLILARQPRRGLDGLDPLLIVPAVVLNQQLRDAVVFPAKLNALQPDTPLPNLLDRLLAVRWLLVFPGPPNVMEQTEINENLLV